MIRPGPEKHGVWPNLSLTMLCSYWGCAAENRPEPGALPTQRNRAAPPAPETQSGPGVCRGPICFAKPKAAQQRWKACLPACLPACWLAYFTS